MRAQWKVHNLIYQFTWSVVYWMTNNVVEMAALAVAIESSSRFDGANES